MNIDEANKVLEELSNSNISFDAPSKEVIKKAKNLLKIAGILGLDIYEVDCDSLGGVVIMLSNENKKCWVSYFNSGGFSAINIE